MSDQPAPNAPPPPAPAPAPAPGDAPPAIPPAAPPAPELAKIPDGLDPKYWDGQSQSVQLEPLVKDFTQLSKQVQTEAERQTALKARKPEDIKIEVKLPETVKIPNGPDGKPLQIGINEKDPRIPLLRGLAIQNGWDQETVNGLVALDAQMQIQNHLAEQTRVAAEDKKLGENGPARKAAIGNWFKAATERGDFTAEESAALAEYAIDAPTVTAFEKLIAKASGSIPGHQPGGNPPPKPADVPMEQRWYPPNQQKAS